MSLGKGKTRGELTAGVSLGKGMTSAEPKSIGSQPRGPELCELRKED